MAVKTNGREYKAYITSEDPKFWPEGSYIDDTIIKVNGIEVDDESVIDDGAEVVIEYGNYLSGPNDYEGRSLESHFKSWRKAQNTTVLTFDVPKGKEDIVKAAVKEALK